MSTLSEAIRMHTHHSAVQTPERVCVLVGVDTLEGWAKEAAQLEGLGAELAALREVADAARGWNAVLSTYCDGPERDRLDVALARLPGLGADK